MMQIARSWRVAVAGLAVGVVGVLGFACPTASAEPVFPPRPNPAPVPAPPVMPQAVTVAPGAVGNPIAGDGGRCPRGAVSRLARAAPRQPPPPAPLLVPARSGTLRDYFGSKSVKMEPQKAPNFNALDITLPMPPGWTQVPDPNVPDAFVVTANRRSTSLYTSNAQLVVYRLVGDFDPKEAITHGYLDSAATARLAEHQRLAGRFQRLPVIDHRGHLPRERNDAQHLAAPRHRHLRTGQVPGVAGGNDRCRRGSRRGAGHRRHRQRVPGRPARVQPTRRSAAGTCGRRCITPAGGRSAAALAH